MYKSYYSDLLANIAKKMTSKSSKIAAKIASNTPGITPIEIEDDDAGDLSDYQKLILKDMPSSIIKATKDDILYYKSGSEEGQVALDDKTVCFAYVELVGKDIEFDKNLIGVEISALPGQFLSLDTSDRALIETKLSQQDPNDPMSVVEL